jgi:hypothetical protein
MQASRRWGRVPAGRGPGALTGRASGPLASAPVQQPLRRCQGDHQLAGLRNRDSVAPLPPGVVLQDEVWWLWDPV